MWTKLDDGFLDHPKVATLGPLGLALHVSGIVYSGRQLTDGYVPSSVVPRLVDFSNVGEDDGTNEKPDDRMNCFRTSGWIVVRRLVNADVWHDFETINACDSCVLYWPMGRTDGYYIHDYLVYNFSRKQVIAEREAARQRRSKGKTDARPNVARTSPDAKPSVSFPAPAPAPALEDQEQPANAGEEASKNGWMQTPPGWSDDEAALVRKLLEHDPAWKTLTPGGVNKLNKIFGRPLVTVALQRLWEEKASPRNGAFPMLQAVCVSVEAQQELPA